jgi:4-hydroxybenzoate polyprenyltransferase
LLFIVIAQYLFYQCVIQGAYGVASGISSRMDQFQFEMLMLASVLIAAGGYVINDYFDLNIDRVNKPEKLVVERFVKRRWAIVWHLLFSIAGLLISFKIAYQLSNILIAVGNFLAVVFLFLYSISFKKRLIIGNVTISLLTAWVIIVLFVAEMPVGNGISNAASEVVLMRIFRLSVVYASFAFITTLVREILKDMEDEEGDRKYGCKTMPIVWGMETTKVFAGVWLFILICFFTAFFFYILFYHWYALALVIAIWFIPMLVIVMRKLASASQKRHFHTLSLYLKIIMLTGMFTMVFYFLYNK